ncbi:MAG: hypothetical protein AB7L17_09685 [Ilumatobacteraceae bacterium]
MDDIVLESLPALLRRLKVGREEAVQRSLTSLIIDQPYPPWNTRSATCVNGRTFLRTVYERAFGPEWPGDDLVFVDEYELRGRTDEERGGAPDWAVLWADRIWLIELKTEVGSHRAAQIPLYFELARFHHRTSAVDVLYVTPTMPRQRFEPGARERFAHLTWDEVAPMVRRAWRSSGAARLSLVDDVCSAIGMLHLPPTEWRVATIDAPIRDLGPASVNPTIQHTTEVVDMVDDPVESALRLARASAVDGSQRALDVDIASLDDLLELRTAVNDAIAGDPDDSVHFVRAWMWRAVSSTGRALTSSGERTGYELRLSRYRAPR